MSFFDGLPSPALAYIGISAVDEVSVAPLADFIREQGLDKQTSTDLVVGLGFLLTSSGLNASNPPSSRQVTLRQLATVLRTYHASIFSVVHYVPRAQSNLVPEIREMSKAWIDACPDAIQINVDSEGRLPSAVDLDVIRSEYPFGARIILSIPRLIISGGDETRSLLDRILAYLAPYAGVNAAVLIDPSEGTGADIDADWAGSAIRFLHDRCPSLSIGVAGGFRPENIEGSLRRIIKANLHGSAGGEAAIPFNIDAQSGLRDIVLDSDGDRVDSMFSVSKAKDYVTRSAAVLRQYVSRSSAIR